MEHETPDEYEAQPGGPGALLVTQDVINAYAKITNDYNPLHVDPEFAATTSLGGVIAHGTMSLALIWQVLHFGLGAGRIKNAKLSIQFTAPVRVGETVSAGYAVADTGEASYRVWVKTQDGTPVIQGVVVL